MVAFFIGFTAHKQSTIRRQTKVGNHHIIKQGIELKKHKKMKLFYLVCHCFAGVIRSPSSVRQSEELIL